MKITDRIAIELASHEAIVRQAYKCSQGRWTWGIGITSASGHNVERYIDNPQPLTKVMEVYKWALEKYAKDVRIAFKGFELTEEQFAAALSFHYNTGKIRWYDKKAKRWKEPTWVSQFKSGEITKAKKSFMNWTKNKELVKRRQKERDLFFDGKWSNRGTIPEYTRLTKNHTPVWGSRQNIDAAQCFIPEKSADEILGEIHGDAKATPVHTPPKETPSDLPKSGNSLWAVIEAIISAFTRGRKS